VDRLMIPTAWLLSQRVEPFGPKWAVIDPKNPWCRSYVQHIAGGFFFSNPSEKNMLVKLELSPI